MQTSKSFNTFLLITLAVLAGCFGSWFYNLGGKDTNGLLSRGGQFIIQDAKQVIIEQDKQTTAVVASSQQVLVGLYQSNAQDKYILTQPQAQALIITSDGWLLTNKMVDENWVAVTENKDIYIIDEVVVDDKSGFVFVHVAEVNDLPVSRFAKVNNLQLGQTVLGVNWFGSVWLATLADINQPLYKSSQDAWSQLSLLPSNSNINQLIVIDLSGQVIGLFDQQDNLRSVDYLIAMINNLLADKPLTMTYLGVNYENLSLITGKEAKNGAKLMSITGPASVIPNSPADLAGLQANDIIISINNIKLDINHDLAEELLNYQPGDTISLSYLRDGKQSTVKITLGEL